MESVIRHGGQDARNVFFLVFARTAAEARRKIPELEDLGFPYLVVCGERCQLPNVIHRAPAGKWDAINFGAKILKSCDLVCLHDADTRIVGFPAALRAFEDPRVDMIFCKVIVEKGPQKYFYKLLDLVRHAFPLIASGELMILRERVFREILPLPPCKTEDNYILFRVMARGGNVYFLEDCFTITERTSTWKEEMAYKRRTATGLYQALYLARPPVHVFAVYLLVPFILPAFLLLGRNGIAWIEGILLGLVDFFIRHDASGKF